MKAGVAVLPATSDLPCTAHSIIRTGESGT